ncbi:MAG: hypothetical protein KKG99_12910, partial [Bacteroidetes bacterium]|nr:hypothetical protein [Bacteroidota bacterium]
SILGVAKLETSQNIMGSFHESEVDYSKRLFKINIESIPSNTQAVVTLHFSLSEAEYITLKEKNELDIKCVYLTTNELGAKKIEIFGYSLKKALDIYRQSFGSNALIDMELKVNVMENNLSDEERTSITRLFEDEGSELVYNTTCNCSDNIKLKKHKLLINY